MTILATHFSLVLGAWRLRVRVDIDEPRDEPLAARAPEPAAPEQARLPLGEGTGFTARGRG